jgi:hypothetical protein
LNLPVSAFYLLAAPSTPDAGLEKVAMRAGIGNGLSVAEVKDIIAKSRRGASLRHLIHVAQQIFRDVQQNRYSPEKWPQVLERHLAGLDREQVLAIVHQKCSERLERSESQLFDLKHEIARLKAIQDWSKGPLSFTPFPTKAGPHVDVPFFPARRSLLADRSPPIER